MAHEANINETQTSILRELLFLPSARFSKLQKKTDLTSDHFTFHVKKLIELGYVAKGDDGTYSLTDSGKEHANRLDTDNNTIERQPKSAVLLLVEKQIAGTTQYLFQQRKKHPYYDFWGVPTGKIRWGETIHEAAKRELMEETGLEADTNFSGVYHEHTKGEDGELLEDKVFFVMHCTNVSGNLQEEFDGGINVFMPYEETKKLPKKYSSFDFEVEFALGKRGEDQLVERTESYTKEDF